MPAGALWIFVFKSQVPIFIDYLVLWNLFVDFDLQIIGCFLIVIMNHLYSDDISLEGLQQELEECKDDDVSVSFNWKYMVWCWTMGPSSISISSYMRCLVQVSWSHDFLDILLAYFHPHFSKINFASWALDTLLCAACESLVSSIDWNSDCWQSYPITCWADKTSLSKLFTTSLLFFPFLDFWH